MMKKNLFPLLALLVAACSGGAKDNARIIEAYQCGDYTVRLDPYLGKTRDLSGGLLTRDGADPVMLDSSDIVEWPMIVGGDGEIEILSKTLKKPDNTIVFQLTRHEAGGTVLDTNAIFSDAGILKNGSQEIECEFIGIE
jgi:hypothetical protein